MGRSQRDKGARGEHEATLVDEAHRPEVRRLICPRCGKKTKRVEICPGFRVKYLLCDRCRRLEEDGLEFGYCGPTPKRNAPARQSTICRPDGPVYLCANKVELAVANAAAERCPAVAGFIPVLAYDAAPWGIEQNG